MNSLQMIEDFLTVEDERIIIEEGLHLDVEKLQHYLSLFKQWIASQNHLPQNFSDNCLKKFLIWAKLDLEKAKKKFQKFSYNPITHREFISARTMTPDGDLKAGEYITIMPMSTLTPRRFKVSIATISNGDTFDLLQMIRFVLIEYDFRIHVDSVVAGEIIVLDMKNLRSRHYIRLFRPTTLKFVKFVTSNYAFLLKNVIIINCHTALRKGIELCKSIVPAKIASRVSVLKDSSDLLKYIPAQCLPADYGGTCKSVAELGQRFRKFLIDNGEFFREISEVKSAGDLPEGIEKLKNESGVDDNFTTLNVD